MTIKAKLTESSAEWGTGKTRCFLCGDNFEYEISYSRSDGRTVPHVRSDDLCNKPCTGNGAHRWDCAALGGDVCPLCARQLQGDRKNAIARLRARARMLAEELQTVEAWLTVDEWDIHADVVAKTAHAEQLADFTRFQELTDPHFAGLPDSAPFADVLAVMPEAERDEVTRIMDRLAPDGMLHIRGSR